MAIERAIQEADQLLATFGALLSIADAEAGGRRADMAPVDLGGVRRDVVELYQPAAEERGVTLELDVRRHHGARQSAIAVPGGRQSHRQCSQVRQRAGRESGSTSRTAPSPRISVADFGPGVPEEERDHVLERFVRLDASRTTPGGGLGLSLVAAIAYGARRQPGTGGHESRTDSARSHRHPAFRIGAGGRPTDGPAHGSRRTGDGAPLPLAS